MDMNNLKKGSSGSGDIKPDQPPSDNQSPKLAFRRPTSQNRMVDSFAMGNDDTVIQTNQNQNEKHAKDRKPEKSEIRFMDKNLIFTKNNGNKTEHEDDEENQNEDIVHKKAQKDEQYQNEEQSATKNKLSNNELTTKEQEMLKKINELKEEIKKVKELNKSYAISSNNGKNNKNYQPNQSPINQKYVDKYLDHFKNQIVFFESNEWKYLDTKDRFTLDLMIQFAANKKKYLALFLYLSNHGKMDRNSIGIAFAKMDKTPELYFQYMRFSARTVAMSEYALWAGTTAVGSQSKWQKCKVLCGHVMLHHRVIWYYLIEH